MADEGQRNQGRTSLGTPPAGVPILRGDPADALQPGDLVGEYRVERKLGEGGMGAVFAGIHPRIGKKVAIKVLASELAKKPDLVNRFENEAKAVNAIGNRHIVDIFAFGQLPDGSPYFVMEWLLGEPLDEYLERAGRLTYSEAMPILRQVCRALSAAHAHGIVHRDLKPENIFLCRDADGTRFVKLLDFGIAKFHGDDGAPTKTRTGMMMGTPYFMSPEQARGRGVDHRTDIYALGVLVYRMLLGRYPFEAQSAMVIVSQHLTEPPPRPSEIAPGVLDPAIEELVLRALAKDADARMQTVDELLQALEACAVTLVPSSSPGIPLPVESAAPPPARSQPPAPTVMAEPRPAAPSVPPAAATAHMSAPRPRSRKGLVLAVAFVLLAGAGGGVAYMMNRSSGAPAGGDAIDVTPLLSPPPARGFKRGDSFLAPR